MQRPIRFVGGGLVALAMLARWNVESLEVATHIGPIVGMAQGGVRFVEAEMAQVIMRAAK